MDPLVGRAVGHYRLVEALGQGGMGVVYRAVDTLLQREVGLKVLPADAVADPERRQAQAASARARMASVSTEGGSVPYERPTDSRREAQKASATAAGACRTSRLA